MPLDARRSASASVSAQIDPHRDHHLGRLPPGRRLKRRAVVRGEFDAGWIDEIGKGVGQAELRGPDAALRRTSRAARDPDAPGVQAAPPGARTDASAGSVLSRYAEQLGELLREVVRRGLPSIALQRVGGRRIGAGGAAEREIDPSGEERAQHAEGFGDLERAVVRQHDAAAADADARRRGGDRADQRLGARAGEHRRAVMFGDPVAMVAARVGAPREVDAVAQRLRAGRAFGDRRLIEHAEAKRHRNQCIAD